MPQRQRAAFFCRALLSLLVLGVACAVAAQDRAADTPQQTNEGSQAIMPQQTNEGHKVMQHLTTETQREADQVRKTAAPAPALSASLMQPEQKARKHEAGVQVQVTGIDIVDPATANEKPEPGQGHLHYQLDSGPIVATTATKLDFHKLSPGKHQITVVLAGNDHQPLGPKETLHVTIPGGR
jgi:hypothetical protein